MEIDKLVKDLTENAGLYPGSRVVIGTSSQVLNREIRGMVAAKRLPIAEGSTLGDEDGECSSLFLVTTIPVSAE
jgi:hypothetical protein